MNAPQTSLVKRYVVLSPHLDDAALSIGGTICTLARTHPVEVWTLFCGAPWCGPYSPLAQWFHSICGGSKGRRLFKRRRLEDAAALTILGVKNWTHFRWMDAIYRRSNMFKFTYTDCRQARWDRSDDSLIDQIYLQVQLNLKPGDILVCPLGIGGHVDHLITNEVGLRISGVPKAWYAEVPYVQRFPDELAAATNGLCSTHQELSQTSRDAWAAAVQSYASQLDMLDEACGNTVKFIEALANRPSILWSNHKNLLHHTNSAS